MQRTSVVVLLGALALATFLRFDGLWEPSDWLDEVLHRDITARAASQPLWKWVAGFEPENGPLYYATQLAGGRLAAALLGLATIALLWLAARAIGDDVAAMVAAILLAVSPLHVYYSREARPYSLLMFLTAALLVLLLRARSPVLTVLVLVAVLYSAAVGAPILLAAAIVALVRRQWPAAAAAAVSLAIIPLLYRGGSHQKTIPGFPDLDVDFFVTLARNSSVSALGTPVAGRAAAAMLLFALIGAIALIRRDRKAAMVVIGLAVMPGAIAIASLWFFDHWYAVRYVVPSLIGYLLLAAIGIAAISQLIARRFGPVLALAIAVAFAMQGWPQARTESWQKLDWRALAETLDHHARPGDLVLTGEPATGIVLPHYLKRKEQLQMSIVPLAERMNAKWVVTTGNGSDLSVRQWTCNAPMVLASALEGLRVHYRGNFLRERAGPAEMRALSAGLGASGITLEMRAHESFLLGEGWSGAEGSDGESFRWAEGERAEILVPRTGIRDRVLRMRVLPLHHPSLPRQTIRVSLNDGVVADLTLDDAWSEPSIAIPARFWIDGLNTLTFAFGRAIAPARLDPSFTDPRPLAAAFDWISVLDAGATSAKAVGVVSLRLADAFIDENTTWRGRTETRFPPQRLRRDAVEALLGRLGFDPQTAWPRIQHGELRLEDLAETIAYGSECESDRDFVRRTYGVLFERAPNGIEEPSLLSMLRDGTSRARLVAHIVKSDELRERVLVALDQPP